MNYRILIITFVLTLLAGCTFPAFAPPSTVTPIAVTPTDTAPPPLPTPELGLAENPLILALDPATNSPDQIDAAKTLAADLTQRTGYTVVVVIPETQAALIEALENGNAHIVLLDALTYEFAYQKRLAKAFYAAEQDGKITYGAQFIASRKSGFISYFDEATQINKAEAEKALAQFADKKPCWSEETSPSGYLVPLGFLNKNLIATKPGAFVQGQPAVVRSVYAGGICDFGTTYIDARKFPSLEDQYPDLMEQVIVIWRVPEIIPYSILAFSTSMPESMQTLFNATIPAILQTDQGKAAFETTFKIKTLLPVTDAYFDEFHSMMENTLVDLITLIR